MDIENKRQQVICNSSEDQNTACLRKSEEDLCTFKSDEDLKISEIYNTSKISTGMNQVICNSYEDLNMVYFCKSEDLCAFSSDEDSNRSEIYHKSKISTTMNQPQDVGNKEDSKDLNTEQDLHNSRYVHTSKISSPVNIGNKQSQDFQKVCKNENAKPSAQSSDSLVVEYCEENSNTSAVLPARVFNCVDCENNKGDNTVKCLIHKYSAEPHCSQSYVRNHKQQRSELNRNFHSTIEKSKVNEFTSELPEISLTNSHVIMFHIPLSKGIIPKPYPNETQYIWDKNYVKMPFSCDNSFPRLLGKRKWRMIHQVLLTPISNTSQLQNTICSYNTKYRNNYTFDNLHSLFHQIPKAKQTYFFDSLLKQIIELALKLESLVTGPLPLLKKYNVKSVSLSQQQIACLLANAFLCTFPDRDSSKTKSEYDTFPNINFGSLFNSKKPGSSCCEEKLRCIINYFKRVCRNMPDGVVTYSRLYVPPEKLPDWSSSNRTLPTLDIRNTGTIEEADGLLQVGFANKMVGGGILHTGCAQEDIRFAIYPELILARLFTEELDDTEALLITGCERFNKYEGYGRTFRWAGDYIDETPRDSSNRRKCSVIAIDALRFTNKSDNFKPRYIERELNKAYVGFHNPHFEISSLSPVATGNWGCGAFGGDLILKALIQLMAAAESRPHVVYFTFGDWQLKDELRKLHDKLRSHHITVSKLWHLLLKYCNHYRNHTESLRTYLLRKVTSKRKL